MSEIIICPACRRRKQQSKHHILPKRFFGNKPYVYYICKKCHIKLEKGWIPQYSILEPIVYWEILEQFLKFKGAKEEDLPHRPMCVTLDVSLKTLRRHQRKIINQGLESLTFKKKKKKERQRCLLKKM